MQGRWVSSMGRIGRYRFPRVDLPLEGFRSEAFRLVGSSMEGVRRFERERRTDVGGADGRL